jgi:hypothetical protein
MGTYKLVWDDFLVSGDDKTCLPTTNDSVTFESDRNAGKQPESIASFYAVLTEEICKFWLQELKKKL